LEMNYEEEDVIQVGANSSDSSGFELAGETFSIDSSITAYRMENGRRYHAYREGVYWAPNDEHQNENLDILHHKYMKLLDGKLLLAPIKKDIKRALDLGTGTGIWAIDFAYEYPETTVLGTDLSPIQPTLVPENLMFEVDDVRDEWIHPPDYFDYVHIRALFGSISDWPGVYNQAFRHITPGGWIEQLEPGIELKSDDGSLTPDSPMNTLWKLFKEAGNITGQAFDIVDTMKRDIEAAGFINVHEKVFKAPLGLWPADLKYRELGRWTYLAFDDGLEGYALAPLTRAMGWNANEVRVLLAQVRQAMKDRKIHSYHETRVVYGQKPA